MSLTMTVEIPALDRLCGILRDPVAFLTAYAHVIQSLGHALLCEREIVLEVPVGIDPPGNNVDKIDAVDCLTFIDSLKIEVVEAVLLVERVNHPFLNWLNNDY